MFHTSPHGFAIMNVRQVLFINAYFVGLIWPNRYGIYWNDFHGPIHEKIKDLYGERTPYVADSEIPTRVEDISVADKRRESMQDPLSGPSRHKDSVTSFTDDLVDAQKKRFQTPTHLSKIRLFVIRMICSVAVIAVYVEMYNLLHLMAKLADVLRVLAVAAEITGVLSNMAEDLHWLSAVLKVISVLALLAGGKQEPGFLGLLDALFDLLMEFANLAIVYQVLPNTFIHLRWMSYLVKVVCHLVRLANTQNIPNFLCALSALLDLILELAFTTDLIVTQPGLVNGIILLYGVVQLRIFYLPDENG